MKSAVLVIIIAVLWKTAVLEGGVSTEKLGMARYFPSVLKGHILGEKNASRGKVPFKKIHFLEEELALWTPPPPPAPHLCVLLS